MGLPTAADWASFRKTRFPAKLVGTKEVLVGRFFGDAESSAFGLYWPKVCLESKMLRSLDLDEFLSYLRHPDRLPKYKPAHLHIFQLLESNTEFQLSAIHSYPEGKRKIRQLAGALLAFRKRKTQRACPLVSGLSLVTA